MKRTAMIRRARLQPGTPLVQRLKKRRVRYDPAVVRQQIALVRSARSTVAQASRIVGCNPAYLAPRVWQETKAAVFARDHHRCLRCSAPANDPHHRINRGQGGSSRPEIAYGMANLVSVCRGCHDEIGEHPAEARATGWSMRRGDPDLPSEVPLTALDGRQFFLTDDGDVVDLFTRETRR